MTSRASSLAAVLVVLAAAALAGCSPASTSAPGSPPASAGAPASSPSAPVPPSAPASPAGDSPSAAASARACAELDAWQKKHGNSAAPPQGVFDDLISAPEPLSGDFTAWDLAAGTSQPGAEADLLKVWTDCARAEAAALGG